MSIDIVNASRLPKDLSVFFCWQDHLEKRLHRYLIRDAINAVIGRVQSELPEDAKSVLRQDSDTIDRSGSVSIADTILEKIDRSTIVVGDVTPVLSDTTTDRYYPNPNVMFELGYAARALGWNRIICLFNEAVYRTEQLPFDVRHRRVASYVCRNASERKSASGQVEGVIYSAIRAILQGIGRGEIEVTSDDRSLRRKRDVRLLRDVMETIHMPTLDFFIDRGLCSYLHYDILFFWHGFEAVVESSDFLFYDKRLQELILALHKQWNEAVSFGSLLFYPGGHAGQYVMKDRHTWGATGEEYYESMMRGYHNMADALREFLTYIHENYDEIDTRETDRIAYAAVRPYIDSSKESLKEEE